MSSLFCCPLCGGALEQEGNSLRCAAGHNFDISSAGYVHLLPANRLHAKIPGDDAGMVAARADFLQAGHYGPLRDKLAALIAARLPENGALLDAGCGEGWYTEGIRHACPGLRMAGVDLSKYALRRAAKRLKGDSFALCSVYHLPVADGALDGLVDVFAPVAPEEYARVLKRGGIFYYVTPAEKHLWELKQVLYPEPYENPAQNAQYEGFRRLDKVPVDFEMALTSQKEIAALFQMTPYYYKTPAAGRAALAQLDRLTCRASFHIHVLEKI